MRRSTTLGRMTATYQPVRDLTPDDVGALLYISAEDTVQLLEILDPPSPATVRLRVSAAGEEKELRLSAGTLLPVEYPSDYLL